MDRIKERFDSLPIAACFFDKNGVVRLINRRMLAIANWLRKGGIQSLAEMRNALRRCGFLLCLLRLRRSRDGHDAARQTLLHAAQAGIARLGIQTGLRLAQAHKAELGVDAAVRAGIEARRRIAQDGRDAQQLARAEQRLQRAQLLRRADAGDHS